MYQATRGNIQTIILLTAAAIGGLYAANGLLTAESSPNAEQAALAEALTARTTQQLNSTSTRSRSPAAAQVSAALDQAPRVVEQVLVTAPRVAAPVLDVEQPAVEIAMTISAPAIDRDPS
ncbi:MAG: hypothetical protein AAF918_07630 [Pseudomonadota bacterium]